LIGSLVTAHLGMLAWRRLILVLTGFHFVDLKILVLSDEEYGASLRHSMARPSGPECRFVNSLSDDVDLVVVDERWTARNAEWAQLVLTGAISRHIPVVGITDFYESMFGRVSPEHANDLGWALDHVLPRAGSPYFAVKRGCDLVVAAVLLVVLSPLMAVVAICLRFIDGGSALYAQERVGHLGRPFRLWKFRTMYAGADAHGPFTPCLDRVDLRVTRFGGWLRRLRLRAL